MKKFFYLIIILIGCNLQTLLAQNSRGPEVIRSTNNQRNVYAIVVGISNYTQVQDLQFADRDATIFAEYLKNDVGVPTKNVKLFTNENATKLNVVEEIYYLTTLVKPNDLVFFYFAGHGDIESKIGQDDAILLLHKCKNTNYFSGEDFIEFNRIRNWMNMITENKTNLICIFDVCRSGGLVGGKSGQERTAAMLTAEWQNQTKLLSCQLNELSLEGKEWGGGRGLFSYHLTEGLQGLADIDNNGAVSLLELQNYLQENVRKQALPHHQTPIVKGNLDQIIGEVNPTRLAALRDQKVKKITAMAKAIPKNGNELLGNDSGKTLNYNLFNQALKDRRLLKPESNCALFYLNQMKDHEDELTRLMRRNLAAALQEKAMGILSPLFVGEKEYIDIDVCKQAAFELRTAIDVLGKGHLFSVNLEARALFLEAYYQAGQKHSKDAIKLLKESVALEPGVSYSYFLSGILYKKFGDYDSATYNYKKYLEFLPNDGTANFNLGIIYLQKRNYPEAAKYLQLAVDIQPKNPLFLGSLSNAQRNLKDYQKAGMNKEKAIQIDQSQIEH